MNPSQIIQAVYDFIKTMLKVVWMRQRVVFDILFLVVAATVGWMVLSDFSPAIVVYVGPRDSASARAGKSVVTELRHTLSPSGIPYRVRIENTTGFEDVRQNVENTIDGIAIGFLTEVENRQGDGDDKTGPLSALLPLDWDYLHVICRTGFLREIERRTGKIPQNLAEVLSYLDKKHRVFLGTAGSNSAKLGEMILDQYGVSTSSHAAPGIADWTGMRQAFQENMIDLAFYCGPVGSKTIMSIASDETVALIGVGPIAEALALQQNMVVVPAQLPENLARAEVVPKVAVGAINSGQGSGEVSAQSISFCPKGLDTIKVRRFLVCSSSLSTADAYIIAQAAKRSLEGDYLIDFNLNRVPSVRDVQAPPSHIHLHPGTELLRDHKSLVLWISPSTWPSWLQITLFGLAFTLGIELLRMGQRQLDELAGLTVPQIGTPSATDVPLSPAYTTFQQRMERCESELETQTYLESDAKLCEWTDRIRFIRNDIRADLTLTDSQREKLLAGVLSLRVDLMSLPRESAPAGKRSRGKSAVAATARPQPDPSQNAISNEDASGDSA